MNGLSGTLIPSLYIKNKGETSTDLSLRLTAAKERFLVRLTGGCGYMNSEDSENLYSLFAQIFEDFQGAMIYGGTRMINKYDKKTIIPGITEIPSHMKEINPDFISLGVIPKSETMQLDPDVGLVVSYEDENDYITIIHPNQDICLIVQQSVDQGVNWETEAIECMDITQKLREIAGWNSLLVSYNGGGITEKEIISTAKKGWPVLLIADSGRKTEEYAKNKDFLAKYPNVMVAEKNVLSIRKCLAKCGAIKKVSTQLKTISNY